MHETMNLKTYRFQTQVFDKDNNLVQDNILSFQDKGEHMAKTHLRLSIQTQYKSLHGYFPRVELKCVNSDIKSYVEDE